MPYLVLHITNQPSMYSARLETGFVTCISPYAPFLMSCNYYQIWTHQQWYIMALHCNAIMYNSAVKIHQHIMPACSYHIVPWSCYYYYVCFMRTHAHTTKLSEACQVVSPTTVAKWGSQRVVCLATDPWGLLQSVLKVKGSWWQCS